MLVNIKKFKIGDTVECLNEGSSHFPGDVSPLMVGAYYIVDGMGNIDDEYSHVSLQGVKGWVFRVKLFRHVMSNEKMEETLDFWDSIAE